MARNAAEVTAAKLVKAKKDYFAYYTQQIYHLFNTQTRTPYKYIAALVGLFGLHPKGFCSGCNRFPIPRTQKLKIQSPTTRINRGIRMCKLENVLLCPKSQTGRQNIRLTIQGQIHPSDL